MNTNSQKTRNMILCAFFTALIAIGAFIRIPLPITVFTMQFIFVLLSGLILGPKFGALSCILYLVIGLIGFPIFSEGGGPAYLLKPTFGYLIAFAITSFIVGLMRKKVGTDSIPKLFVICLIGMFITYLLGTLYTYFILNFVAKTPTPYWACVASLFPVVAVKDVVSCFVSAATAKKISKKMIL